MFLQYSVVGKYHYKRNSRLITMQARREVDNVIISRHIPEIHSEELGRLKISQTIFKMASSQTCHTSSPLK
jgi:hypothetical protein